MCGIAGIVHLDNQPVPDMARRLGVMSRLIVHRGPDDYGIWISPESAVGFAHRRLSIFDLSPAGRQPMLGEDGAVMLHNGEVYNFPELKTELAGRWRFKTQTDTEVMLAAHAMWGDEAVQKFRGMFAYARWEPKTKRMVAARDRMGVKPFYYTIQGRVLYFASEMKALLPFVPAIETDPEAFAEYVTFQYTLGQQTMFRHVRQLLPGFRLIVQNGQVREERYWDVHYHVDHDHTEDYFQRKLTELVNDSLSIHLRSDVPVGSYLSGGIDSSLIAMLSSNLNDKNNQFFHGKFTQFPGYDESNYAQVAADAARGRMHEIDITADMFSDSIGKIIYHLDTPVAGPGSFPQYFVSKLARERVTVCLGGQGGDEVFGGYARYLVAYLEQCIRAAIDGTYQNGNFVVTLESIIPRLGMLREYQPMLQMLWKEGLFGPLDERYFRLINRSNDMSNEIRFEELPLGGVFEKFKDEFNRENVGAHAYFDKMTHFDLKFLLPALLQVEDRMSMAHGLESRVPFLDHPIIEFAATIPANVKYKEGESKYILKEAYREVLPEQLLTRRDKMGFPVPLKEWFSGELKDFLGDMFASASANERAYIHRDRLAASIGNSAQFSRKAWGLLSLELWHQQYHDRSAEFASMLDKAPLDDSAKVLQYPARQTAAN